MARQCSADEFITINGRDFVEAAQDVHLGRCDPREWSAIDFHPDLEMMRHYASATTPMEHNLEKKLMIAGRLNQPR